MTELCFHTINYAHSINTVDERRLFNAKKTTNKPCQFDLSFRLRRSGR